MATKTFEELKQLAIQIRDEKTNKQNTATRVGTAMLEHINKLEQDYYDKTKTDEELKERDDKLTELSSHINTLDSLISDVEEEVKYTKEILSLDKAYNLSGSVATEEPVDNPGYNGTKIKVLPGECYIVSTYGGAGGSKSLAITDNDRKILYRIETQNLLDNPSVVNIENEGYLYVNCMTNYLSYFYIRKIYSYIDKLKESVNNNANDIKELQILSDSISDNLSYNGENLVTGFWNGKNGVGQEIIYDENPAWSTIPDLPIKVYSGDVFELKTMGGANARAYILTDVNNIITSMADANYNAIDNPLTINIESDGYLYVSCAIANKDSFSLRVFRSKINSLKSDLSKKTKIINSLTNEFKLSLGYNGCLRILSVSNSLGCDAVTYMPYILKNIGYNDFEIGICYLAGASLQDHVENLNNQPYTNFFFSSSQERWESNPSSSLLNALQKSDWDIIVLQQNTNSDQDYNTYEPYLSQLIDYINTNTDYKPTYYFHMTWPGALRGNEESYQQAQEEEYKAILNSMYKVYKDYGLRIIPCGVAMQLARATELNNYGNYAYHQLTSDGKHADGGIGRILISYTWLASLGINIGKASYYPNTDFDDEINSRGTFDNVNTRMSNIAKKCAIESIIQYNLLQIEHVE